MSRVEQIGSATLYLGSFSDLLAGNGVPDRIHLVVTDPPYKLTSGGQPESSIAMRGGWKEGPPDYETATCEEHETAAALRSHAQPK